MSDVSVNRALEEDIKPNITNSEVESILDKFYGLKGGSLKQLEGYDDLNYHVLPKISKNSFVTTPKSHGYVLKVMNSLDSTNTELCEAQNAMMLFLREHHISSPIPIQTVTGHYYTRQKFPSEPSEGCVQKEHIIRLLEFQPGVVLKDIPKSYSLFYQLGKFLAELNGVLKEFFHPVYETHHSIWHLKSIPELQNQTKVVGIPKRRKLVNKIIQEFIDHVLTKADTFEKGMIHGDFNEHNILMSKEENGKWMVSAILDFGDSHQSCYLFELAVALCYMMFECKRHDLNPITGAGHLLAGYLAVQPNFPVNCGLLRLCICARICQSLVLGLKAFKLHPENKYVLGSQQMGWPLLEELWALSVEKLTEEWNNVIQSYSIKHSLKSVFPCS